MQESASVAIDHGVFDLFFVAVPAIDRNRTGLQAEMPPRFSQNFHLRHLASDIQEAVRFRSRVLAGQAPVTVMTLRPITEEELLDGHSRIDLKILATTAVPC